MTPEGWKFELLDDDSIRVTDPKAPYPLIIFIYDQAPAMRIFWRLVTDLMEQQDGETRPEGSGS